MWWIGLSGLLAGCSDFALNERKDPPEEGQRVLEVDPGVIDFGTLDSGAMVTEVVTVASVGDLPVTLSGIDVTGSAAYGLTGGFTETTLEPGDTMDVVVTYAPASILDEATLIVSSDAIDPKAVVALRGAGIYPGIQIDPSALSFQSDYGEPVEESVVVTSVGTADLDLSDMLVQGESFTAEGDVPVILAPGESIVVNVTYTPTAEDQYVSGMLWFTTNTPSGFAVVPLDAHQGPVCMGLGEAWDRGLLDPHTNFGSALQVENLSTDEKICIDEWYLYLSDESQDMGVGDMDGDVGGDYPTGSLSIDAADDLTFGAASRTNGSWWCVELTQYTQQNKPYEFLGARVPEPLRTYMLERDQDAVWAYEDYNPVMIAARRTNYLEVGEGGGTGEVTIRPLNMGSRAGVVEVRETIPAGYAASGFSVVPTREEVGADGATVFVFTLSLDARIETGEYEATVYDDQEITYTLAVPSCLGRQYLPPMSTTWTDSDGELRTDTANPLVVRCL
jgi:hypothetical protein